MSFYPHYYQIDSHDSAIDYIITKEGNPLIGLPTGTGKSIVIGMLTHTITSYPFEKVLICTHVKELIEQDIEALNLVSPSRRWGVHCAGLRKKDCAQDIIFASVQTAKRTISKNKNAFGVISVMIIDEAHLVNNEDETNYKVLIDALKESNPNLKIIGLTATPFRTKNGCLTEAGIFTDFCYNRTSYLEFNKFIEEGFLSPLVPKATKATIDISGVKIQAGEFNQSQLEQVSNDDKINLKACDEILHYGQDRRSWLIFCAGIKHAERVTEILLSKGVDVACVHSEKSGNEDILKQFRAGKIRCVVNANKLTTGYNCPQLDLIGVLRATNSPVTHVQMLGRGTRPAEGKVNCLVLDFARNVERLGPINDPIIPRPKGKGPAQAAPAKLCPKCEVYNHVSARECFACGYEFPIQNKLSKSASTHEMIKGYGQKTSTNRYRVSSVIYDKVKSKNSGNFLKITYSISGEASYNSLISENILMEHEGSYPQFLARQWWKQVTEKVAKTNGHLHIPMPKSVDSALQMKHLLTCPSYISVEKEEGSKYYKVTERTFE